ncbi:glucose 1-dehydrogenase [Solirubrobacter ginsenosidimutans]|uniref:Glucose 1-dehydrogenase n=1 Tax=Solirubrobacter ginsenosidimutans TaxID=490573 RepID=A0A9X3MSW2_9ACTN|nr:glucose 1-dehydrogenase [Solirubrobacter ginsenosidimutans]MDA0159053.1 glucose 1-dehydrogenase [Solirubrobacter ginsenosidimutans]
MTAHPLFDIDGRTALVTGSSRGIGRAFAQGLLEAGCTVVMHGRDPDRVRAAADALEDDRVHHVAFDVTDAEAVAIGVEEAETLVGPLDVLVNNVGIQHRAPLLDFPDAAWQELLDTNLTSAFLVARAVARGMVARGRGKIVNIASVQSALARPGIAPYAATKGALKMLTQGMCADWAPAGLQINALAPGYIDTELTQALVEDAEFSRWLRARTPAARWGTAEDLIGALLFLSSPASDFVNGHTLYVDGGMLAVV